MPPEIIQLIRKGGITIDNSRKDLAAIRALEQRSQPVISNSAHALGFHLMPPVGWLNDPNGLCENNGIYHIFFQYSPTNPKGGSKYWGHYTTKNFIDYNYTGPFMSPDNILDRDGVYSGSAFTHNGEIYIYYTGNVKEEGDFDYTYFGRLSNTILVKTDDGSWTDSKKAVLTNKDYPEHLSCHIRDPKVFKMDDAYGMVLGARTSDDVGCVLLYRSDDLINWNFDRFINSSRPFGYMWECPDIIDLDGHRYLSISPQGVDALEFSYQNVYQSGYYRMKTDSYDIDEDFPFIEWDMGFDFYAPQTFMDESGRYILIGWMGIPDADYNNDPSVSDGWQHALTLARELVVNSDGQISQRPLAGYESLREKRITPHDNTLRFYGTAEILASDIDNRSFSVTFDKSLIFKYDSSGGILTLAFDANSESSEGAMHGCKRDCRRAKINELRNFRVFLDNSSIEIFVNDGELVFSSRYYKEEPTHEIIFFETFEIKAYILKNFTISI